MNPLDFRSAIASDVLLKYLHGTDSVAPSAVFCISLCGGVEVIPHRYIESVRKASAVLNIDPTLL